MNIYEKLRITARKIGFRDGYEAGWADCAKGMHLSLEEDRDFYKREERCREYMEHSQ